MYLKFRRETIPCESACRVRTPDGKQIILVLLEREAGGDWSWTSRPAADLVSATDPHATSYLRQEDFDAGVRMLGAGHRFIEAVEAEPD
jgi:hypothetical protein